MNSTHSNFRRYAVRFGPALGVAIVYLLLLGLPARRELIQQCNDCEIVSSGLKRMNVEELNQKLAATKDELCSLSNQLAEQQNNHSAYVASNVARNAASGDMQPASVTAALIEHFARHQISCHSVIPQHSHPWSDDVETSEKGRQRSKQSNATPGLKLQLHGDFGSMRNALGQMDHNVLPITIEAIEMSEVDTSSSRVSGHSWIITLRLPEGHP